MPDLSLSYALTFLFLSLLTWRIARFLILDDLIEELRDKFHRQLTHHPNKLTIKLQVLMLCPFCLTIWVSIAVNVFHFTVIDPWPGWQFVEWVVAVAAGSMVFWKYIDSED